MTRRIILASIANAYLAGALAPPSMWGHTRSPRHDAHSAPHNSRLSADIDEQEEFDDTDDRQVQWSLFKKYHARGSWRGIWSTYDGYIGDMLDETVASVNLIAVDERTVHHTHEIVVEAKRADCSTCFDSMETKKLFVATYTANDLRKMRLASRGLVNGPALLRSGAVATELALVHGDGRVRVVFQHAPVWERGVEPGSCPPHGLRLFRAVVSREALRPAPPTAESERSRPPAHGDPIFYRPVPPFDWHKIWGGTSWTWGPNAGDRGWQVDRLEDADAWHGETPPQTWNLRLPGGLFVQAPKMMTEETVGMCRLAWLPTDENLLRIEAGIVALQPMSLGEHDVTVLAPPSLASLRCDVLQKLGNLEGQPQFNATELGQSGAGLDS